MSLLIETENLSFKYSKDNIIFENLNLKLHEGETLGLKGNSGSGKTTLCNLLCGIIPNICHGVTEGKISIRGKNICDMSLAEISTYVGIVFQDAQNQFFAPTLEENLAFAPENLKLDAEEIEKRVANALNIVGLTEYRYFSPFKLSEGQKHLAALASLITLDPKVIILDEIMACLDKKSRELVLDIIKCFKLNKKAIIIVEHDDKYMESCDKILKLENKCWVVL